MFLYVLFAGLLRLNKTVPWAKVPHLASHLLSRIVRRLSDDWQALRQSRHSAPPPDSRLPHPSILWGDFVTRRGRPPRIRKKVLAENERDC